MIFDELLAKLEGVKRKDNGRATARCPGPEHDRQDQRPSLSLWLTPKGKIAFKCHRGCGTDTIDAALGITWKDRMPAREGMTKPTRREICAYDYKDESGTLLFQNVRYDPKDFLQRRPDGKGGWVYKMTGVRRVIYKLPELMVTP